MRRKSLILKIPSLGANYEALARSTNVYAKEVFVLDELLPQIYKLQTEGESFTANYYGSTDKLTVFLEDLTDSGYFPVEKTTQLDLNHCEIALKTLARFHALSRKYLKTTGEKSLALEVKTPSGAWNFTNQNVNRTIDLAGQFASAGIHEKLVKFRDSDRIRLMWSTVEEASRNTIIHGDYWTANILFKYDDGRVCDAKMIDWQLCRVCSPAVELIYFFVTSVPFEIFENSKTQLLDCYLNEFNDTLTRLQCDDKMYTRDELEGDFHSCRIFFVIYTLFSLQFVLKSDPQNCTKSSKFIIVLLKWLSYIETQNIL